ncbi:MAG: peptidoglycan-binding protein [Actinobacteria bacterium]|nr:peptidoglycan-binding protein [Actinomycetota bacterium]
MKLLASVTSLSCIMAVFTLTAPTVLAATNEGSFASRGLGARNCSEIIDLIQGPNEQIIEGQLAAWVAGYISHANRATQGVFDVMAIQDTSAVTTLVARICAQNPESLMEPAMATLLSSMSSAAQTTGSQILTVTHEDLSTIISQESLRMLQERLISLELLNDGSADGAFGPQTRGALERFQESKGLVQTGLPDPLTLFVAFSE